MIDGRHMSAPSPLFVRKVGEQLRLARRAARRPLWHVAQSSHGRFGVTELRDAEAGLLPLDAGTVADLAALYGLDVTVFLPSRDEGLLIDQRGTLSAGGRSASFVPGDSASLVAAYFSLVRELRSLDDDQPMRVRSSDVSVIAEYLGERGDRSTLLEAMVAVAEAQRRVTVSSLLVGAASAGLIELPPDSAAQSGGADQQQRTTPRSVRHPAVLAKLLEQGF